MACLPLQVINLSKTSPGRANRGHVKEKAMPSLGPFELIIILVIVIIFFGVGKLPEIGGAIGRSLAEFRNANRTDDSQVRTSPDQTAP